VNIVSPYSRLMAPIGGERDFSREDGIELLRRIEWCGRISHRSEDSQTPDSWERFIRAVVIGHGDWSIVEHASVSVDFLVDRGVTHEQVRHRLFSPTQESPRFVNYEKKMPPSFVYPDGGIEEPIDQDWADCIAVIEATYKKLIHKGWPPQKARSVFPNALASRIVISGNLRNWRYAMIMRTTRETHPQFRQVTIPLLAQLQEKVPILFEDITPLDKQSEAIKKGR
jgi:thymidylate synthase (FAD)